MMTENRPNPDALLALLHEQSTSRERGKLKIFFGANAGVGKTYAMLLAAHEFKKKTGKKVAVGIVETHGRKETADLLMDLEVLPFKKINYRNKTLSEFDLDKALEIHPDLLLVDELAHTNIPNSRHPQRWQDIEELLGAGIDVYTTLNVQHLESLNDVVGHITQIRVNETVPDEVFDKADEVVLVDLPPDELLQRMKDGKVYMPQQAEHALKNFFRKGNLIALREMALRRTADRVDEDVRAYRKAHQIDTVWSTGDGVLACIGVDQSSENVIRSVARLAEKLNARWHVIYVETPKLQHLPELERQRILKTLKLAESLGGHSAISSGEQLASSIIAYAREHNFSRVVLGHNIAKSNMSRMFHYLLGHTSLSYRILKCAPELELIQVPFEATPHKTTQPVSDPSKPSKPFRFHQSLWSSYLLAIVGCALTTGVALMLRPYFDLANIVMVFLLGMVLIALRLGRGATTFSAMLNVAVFDYLFVEPRFSFAVSDVQYLLTFAIMLLVGLLIGQIMARLRYQASVSNHREQRSRLLYEIAKDLSAALTEEQIISLSKAFVENSFRVKVFLLLPDAHDKLNFNEKNYSKLPFSIDFGIAQWAFDHVMPAGFTTDTLPGHPILYLPLKAAMRIRGVLALQPSTPHWLMVPEQRRQLDTIASLIAIALERVHYVEVAREAVLNIESERLRNSLLSAISHDIRTPLTSLHGLAESLSLTQPALTDRQKQIATDIQQETLRLKALVHNLLDMARLESGDVHLKLEWQSIEEVIGSSLHAMQHILKAYQLHTHVPRDLPLIPFDAVLIERVLCNLLENAVKYSEPGTAIRLCVEVHQSDLWVSVIDEGCGIQTGFETKIFEKFTRGKNESSISGIGLGLSICRHIIEIHHGKIWVENQILKGSKFIFSLPIKSLPPEFTI